jgi:hypothetical protein
MDANAVSKEEVLSKYSALAKDFETTCVQFDPIKQKIEKTIPEVKNDILLNWHPDFEAVSQVDEHLQNCIFIDQSVKLDSIGMPKIKSSVEFIKEVSGRVIDIVESYSKKQDAEDKNKLIDIKNKFVHFRAESLVLEDQIQGLITPKEATSECSDYNRSIIDLQFGSRNLSILISRLNARQGSKAFWYKLSYKNRNDTRENITNRWGNLESVFEIVKNKIQTVSKRFKGILAHSGTCLLCLLKTVKDSLDKGANKIIHLFTSIIDGFLDLMQTLTEKMFNFMAQIDTMAKKSGFQISQLNMTMPSIKFEYVNLFMISLPVPQIESPEISVSFDSK